MGIVEQLVVLLGGTSAAVAALAYLAKSLMNNILSKDLESFKAELSSNAALELEGFRNEMRKQVLEHEIRYKRIDEKMADCLNEVYIKFVKDFRITIDYVGMAMREVDREEERVIYEKVLELREEFWVCFLSSRIYIPPSLYRKIQKCAQDLSEITEEFWKGRKESREKEIDIDKEYWHQAVDRLTDEADPLFDEIVRECQMILGIKDRVGAD